MFYLKMNVLFLILICSHGIFSLNPCESNLTCEECIKESVDCIWCALDNYNGNRCKMSNNEDSNWCIGSRVNPTSEVNIKENQNFSSDTGNIIQIKPQNIKISLRPGQEVHFDFSFKNAKDYPVDLYFLMDGSISMKPIKDKTMNQSENIYKTMKSMTRNVFLGMGSFVDKNILPYTNIINSTLAYSFKNRLKLTDNFQVFQEVVKNTEFGLNYDQQEGTLDALAQVIVCKNITGWRNESRKIIILVTDSSFHAAGDGKYGGIVRPFDGKCNSQSGVYTKELELDYPSVSLINKLAADEEMTIIFAVDADHINDYKSLTTAVSGSKSTNYEEKDMVTILSSIYQEITSNLKLKVSMKSEYKDYFKISFNPECRSKTNNKKCQVKPGEEKNIKGTIKLLKYFTGKDKSIGLFIEGIKEKLTLDIEIIESCNCNSEINSEFCSSRGTKRCGICECNKGSLGDKCQCHGDSINDVSNKTCIPPESNKVCNGFGDCVCGACICKERFKGKFCECNQDSCPRGENGLVCSNLGECNCGTCKCKEGWADNDCSCPTSKSLCSDGDIVCNNRGQCLCGVCKCEPIAVWDARNEQTPHCTVTPCAACHVPQCHLLEACALCYLKKGDCKNCGHLNVTVVQNITETSWNDCPNARADVGCYMKFVYRYAEDRYGIDVMVQTDLDCAETYFALGGGIIGMMILIGILTLIIWKCITDYKDKREYEQFTKEIAQANCHYDNPLYESATRSFQNPAFRKRSIY